VFAPANATLPASSFTMRLEFRRAA